MSVGDCKHAIRFDSGIYACQCSGKKDKPTYCCEDGRPPLDCKDYKKWVKP